MAKENARWGCVRISGKLRKLGIRVGASPVAEKSPRDAPEGFALDAPGRIGRLYGVAGRVVRGVGVLDGVAACASAWRWGPPSCTTRKC
jgi:hypothetical protein